MLVINSFLTFAKVIVVVQFFLNKLACVLNKLACVLNKLACALNKLEHVFFYEIPSLMQVTPKSERCLSSNSMSSFVFLFL